MQANPPVAPGAVPVVGARLPPQRGATNNLWVNLPVYISLCALVTAFLSKTAMHQIPEGHVGMYWRGGRLLSRVTPPGIHLRVPLLDVYEAVQVTMQTDKVVDILCGTKGGVNIYFGKIEVVNRLRRDLVLETIRDYGVHYDRTWIYDKLHHEINQFCSSHTLQEVYVDRFDQVDEMIKEALQADCNRYAPGIEIIAVRVSKPDIPQPIMANYIEMEVQRTKVLVAAERQRVTEREMEVERAKAVAEAQRLADTSRIRMEQLLAEKEAAAKQAQIDNDMYLAKQKVLADADAYRLEREAAANRLKLTPEYLEWAMLTALANNTKVFFGPNIPSLFMDQRLLGLGVMDSLRGGGGGRRGGGNGGGGGAQQAAAASQDD